MNNKPNPKDYGYVPANTTEDEPGWALEGGEEAYNIALQIWECNPPKQEELQSQYETDLKEHVMSLKEAVEKTTVSSLENRFPTFTSVKDWHHKTEDQKKLMEDGFRMLNDMVSKQIKSEARSQFNLVAGDLLRLIFHYDCRPSEIAEIICTKSELNSDSLSMTWWQSRRIVDIKINKKD